MSDMHNMQQWYAKSKTNWSWYIYCYDHNEMNQCWGRMFSDFAVVRKHGKFLSFLRMFFNTRPPRNQLKQSGIVKERVFGCDLGEHLLNSGHDGKSVCSMSRKKPNDFQGCMGVISFLWLSPCIFIYLKV